MLSKIVLFSASEILIKEPKLQLKYRLQAFCYSNKCLVLFLLASWFMKGTIEMGQLLGYMKAFCNLRHTTCVHSAISTTLWDRSCPTIPSHPPPHPNTPPTLTNEVLPRKRNHYFQMLWGISVGMLKGCVRCLHPADKCRNFCLFNMLLPNPFKFQTGAFYVRRNWRDSLWVLSFDKFLVRFLDSPRFSGYITKILALNLLNAVCRKIAVHHSVLYTHYTYGKKISKVKSTNDEHLLYQWKHLFR